MKLLIIGTDSWENTEIRRIAKSRGHAVMSCRLRELSFAFQKNIFLIYLNKKKLPRFDVCLVRGISPHAIYAKILLRHLASLGTRIVDGKLVSGHYEFHKVHMTQELIQSRLPVVDTFYFLNKDELKKNLNLLPRRIVYKEIQGMRCRNMGIIDRSKLVSFMKKKTLDRYFFQPFIKAMTDLRIMVVGRKVLGGIRRSTYFYN